jgi:cytochrome c oxidase subunit 2
MGEESTRAEADPLGGRGGRRTITQMVVVGLVASALGIALGLVINWFPTQGSKQAERIDTFWDVLIICSVPVFVLVTTVVLFAVRDFRMRPGEENLDGPPIHGNTKLEVVWTAIPAIMLIALSSYAYERAALRAQGRVGQVQRQDRRRPA